MLSDSGCKSGKSLHKQCLGGWGRAVLNFPFEGVMGMLRVLRLMRGNQCLPPRDLHANRKEQPWNRLGSSDRRATPGD